MKKIHKLRMTLSGLTGAVILGGGCIMFRSFVEKDTKVPIYKDVTTTYKVSKVAFYEDDESFVYPSDKESKYLSKKEINDLEYFNDSEGFIENGFIYKVNYNDTSEREQTREEDYEDFYYTFLSAMLGATTFGLIERVNIENEKESYQKVKR